MAQIFFLDTNVILDYLENRNQEVSDIISQLLLFHEKDKILLATSVFNVAELIDNEFQIRFIGACMTERMSGDEIISKLRDREQYRQIAEANKDKVEKKIRDFIFKNQIEVLSIPFNESRHYVELYNLIYNHQLRSQDALIVASAFLNSVTYFLTNDSDLVDTINRLLNTFNLRDKKQRDDFRDYVLKAI